MAGFEVSINGRIWVSTEAQVRLCKRFRRLVARGKHSNIAVTAIARELLAFMWAIAKTVLITA